MVTTKLNLSMTEPYVRQIYAKEGDTGRVLEIGLDDYPTENGTLRILRPDGVEVTADAIKSAGGDAYKGDLVTFSALEEVPLTKCEVSLESSQDLHGQSSPYPSGGGVNKLPPMVDGTYEGNGVKAVVKDGIATLSGTTTSSGNALIIPLAETFTVSSGGYYHLCNSNVNAQLAPTLENGNDTSQNISYACSPADRIVEVPANRTGQTYTRIRFYLANNITISGTYSPMICMDNTPTDYAPYSNICPIEPSNGVNLVPSIAPTVTRADVTFTPNADGSIYAHGTANGTAYYCFTSADGDITNYSTPILKAGTVVYGTTRTNGQLQTRYTDGTYGAIGKNIAVTLAKDVGCIYIQYSSGTEVDETIYPMVSLVPHEYVPYQGINLKHFGKNLFDANSVIYGYWSSTKWNENSTWGGVLIPCKPNQKISVSGNPTEQGVYGAWLNQHETPTQGLIERFSYKNVSLFTAPSGAYGFWLPLYKGNDWSSLQIEYADAPTTYEAPTDNSHSISLGRSVYGGKVDLVSGKLTVTKAYDDLGEYAWSTASNNRFLSPTNASSRKPPSANNKKADLICTNYATQTYADLVDAVAEGIGVNANSPNDGNICIRDTNPNYTTATIFKNAMSGVYVCYELREPIEVDLTPTQITTLLGTNNIWSSGEVDVEFSYDSLFATLPSQATEVVGRCIGDVDFNGASTMPFTLVVKPNNKEIT